MAAKPMAASTHSFGPWEPKDAATLRRVATVVTELVRALPDLSERMIQIALYLAEVRSIEERLARLTGADFAAWHHGPWSIQVRQSIDQLCHRNVLQHRIVAATGRAEVQVFRARSTGRLDEGTRAFLHDFAEEVERASGESLLGLARATTPWKRTGTEKKVDLDGFLKEMRAKHEAMQRSEKTARLIAEAIASP